MKKSNSKFISSKIFPIKKIKKKDTPSNSQMKYMKVFGMMMCYMMIDTQLKLSRQLIIYLQKKAYKKDHNFHIINFKYMYMI